MKNNKPLIILFSSFLILSFISILIGEIYLKEKKYMNLIIDRKYHIFDMGEWNKNKDTYSSSNNAGKRFSGNPERLPSADILSRSFQPTYKTDYLGRNQENNQNIQNELILPFLINDEKQKRKVPVHLYDDFQEEITFRVNHRHNQHPDYVNLAFYASVGNNINKKGLNTPFASRDSPDPGLPFDLDPNYYGENPDPGIADGLYSMPLNSGFLFLLVSSFIFVFRIALRTRNNS